jgi:hypothetical protein
MVVTWSTMSIVIRKWLWYIVRRPVSAVVSKVDEISVASDTLQQSMEVDAGVSIQTRTLSGWLLVVIRRNDDRFLAV